MRIPALASAMLTALLTTLAAPVFASPPDEATSAKLEFLARLLPDGAEPAAGMSGIATLVEHAGSASGLRLASWSAQPTGAAQTSGDEAFLPVSFVATFDPRAEASSLDSDAPGIDVRTLVDELGRSRRLTLFDWLELTAIPEGSLRLSGVVRLFYASPSMVNKPEERVHAKVEAIARLKARTPWPLERVQKLAATASGVTFTSLRLEPTRLVAQGLLPWPFGASAPEMRGLDPTRFEWQRRGSCQEFELEASVREEAGETPAGSPAKDARLRFGWPGEAYCAAAPAVTRRLPAVRLEGKGPLTLRARDLDLSQVVWLLHREAGQTVVIEGNVNGALDADFSNVTLDDAMAALKTLGVFTTRADRVRVVSAEAMTAAPRPPGHDLPVSFSFTQWPFASVLHLREDLTGDRVLLAAPEPPPVAIFASEVPWDEIYAALFAATHLVEQREGGFIVLRPRSGPVATPAALRSLGSTPRLGKPNVAADDFELAAISSSQGVFTAWIRSPRGALLDYRAGDHYFDGSVKSVEAEQLTLDVLVNDPFESERVRVRRVTLPAVR